MKIELRAAGSGALALLSACAPANEYKPPPPPAVTVATPANRDVLEYAEFTGSTIAYRVIEIRARVQGYLKEIAYQPGEIVEKGALLFRIDPEQYEAEVHSARADVDSARADLEAAKAEIARFEAEVALADTAVQKLEKAYESRAVSEIQVLEVKAKLDVSKANLDNAKARKDVAGARVGVAQAKLERAELDLSFTTVTAPIRGRAAMWRVEVGALIGAGDTLLTTMFDDSKVYCYFDVTENWLLEIRGAIREAEGRPAEPEDIVVELSLADEVDFPHLGVLDYAEPTIDPSTGTLRVRGIFENEERVLPSGAFARVRVAVGEHEGALLVTERAIGSDQSGDFLLVVNSQDVVERRDVELGSREGDEVVVVNGLRPDDRVVVAGLQRARPGAPVTPESAE